MTDSSELMERLIGRRVNESTVYSPQKRLHEGLHDFEEKRMLATSRKSSTGISMGSGSMSPALKNLPMTPEGKGGHRDTALLSREDHP